jgi:hypothetical protein
MRSRLEFLVRVKEPPVETEESLVEIITLSRLIVFASSIGQL